LTTTDDHPGELEAACAVADRVAREAGQLLLEGWGRRPEVSWKGIESDPVTEFDRRSEALILERLAAAFPRDAVVGEEGGAIAAAPDARVWYVDPLDGTANFAHGLPLFAVSIGLARAGAPLVGVVHAPALGWTFTGVAATGAWRDGERLQVSPIDRVRRALVVTGMPPAGRDVPHSNLPEIEAMAAASQGVRRLGSAALDLCCVACGWLDGYWERHVQPWDLVGGAAIVQGAGGAATDLDGRPFDGRTGRVLASNGRIHGELSALLESVARRTGAPWP
jgi:myo-inositol-1(or 4)-monophosphatase